MKEIRSQLTYRYRRIVLLLFLFIVLGYLFIQSSKLLVLYFILLLVLPLIAMLLIISKINEFTLSHPLPKNRFEEFKIPKNKVSIIYFGYLVLIVSWFIANHFHLVSLPWGWFVSVIVVIVLLFLPFNDLIMEIEMATVGIYIIP